MKTGLYLANFGAQAHPRAYAELAAEAEQAGWDGFFLWDHILYNRSQKLPMLDPWITLSAAAMSTQRLRLGTTVTPVARRRPWKLARETVTLDQLSNGRLVLSVGLGEPADAEFTQFGEDGGRAVRAKKLDEGLAILNGLWSGRSFQFQGEHFQVLRTTFLPPPLQQPRIPVWIGGFWPNPGPFHRAARWDGVIPLAHGGLPAPQDIAAILDFIRPLRASTAPFDAVVIGTRPRSDRDGRQTARRIREFEAAGATWWLQSLYMERNSTDALRESIRRGPPGM
jgi:alkanesulfonate monooxygenase SsuD/methylene tetrahydromethanopterin reductase-like flavin-dependent oxidoreductase (luciferase family)